ncbi:ataxin-2 [Biomphalaria glabrata]|nr:ataxin-2 [Biomphalaria glabrata]
MCFLVDDDEDGQGGSSGSPKLQLKRHHTWLVPQRVLMIILTLAIIFLCIGLVLMAIGGGIGSIALKVIGGVLFGFGVIGLLVCLTVCLYAYFCYGTRDQEIQTELAWNEDYLIETPGYASIGRPSALKSADSTLKRNGIAGQKKVTMAPEVGPYGDSPPNVQQPGVIITDRQPPRSPSFVAGGVYNDGSKIDPRGAGGRSVGGADVGTGGIRILPADQPFPSPAASQVSYISGGQVYSGSGVGQQMGYGASQGSFVYGGGSSASSSIDTYAYPKSVSIISGTESGYADSGTGSQYSTLRSIPVQHVVSGPQQQRQQTQGLQQDHVEYARVNKQTKNIQVIDAPLQRGYIIQGQGQQGGFTQGQAQQGGFTQVHGQQGGFSQGQSGFSQGQGVIYQGQGQQSSFSQGQSSFVQGQGQSGQFQQTYNMEDFDYDNPVERTPMLPPKQSPTYHEQQMQYQRQQHGSTSSQSDLYAPRQLNTMSLQRQKASNPYSLQQQQQQQQNQMQYQTSQTSSTSRHFTSDDDIPEPQPLVYPSARRPMTFEQVSSSKMSVYDNVLAGLKDIDD